MKTYIFKVQIELDEDGRWAACCPDLPGCATYGRTREEALSNIREAVEVYVQDLVESGDPIPGASEVIPDLAVSVVA